ncbi:CotS family spore coat protein [Heliorestis acidaminivorans]|uniref:CotS family spore coat protein n=1 Tax=Heliorestis acidaminivorans TaxID=553427 RepID=UPI0014786950|nr:CotS family spore coat protein [Heliorestis acidaminivorans]
MTEEYQDLSALAQEEQEVLEQYPYKVIGTKRRGRGWRLETDRGPKGLYCYHAPDRDRIFAIHHALEQLASKGFRHTSRNIRTRQGEPFVRKGDYYYTLVDWYNYPRIDFRQDRDLQIATRNLAMLHRLGQVRERQEKVDQRLGKKSLEKRNQELKGYRQRLDNKSQYSPFDELFLEHAERMEQKSTTAMEKLINNNIDQLFVESAERGTVCHRNWTERNLRISPDNNLAIIGWDNCGTDVPIAEFSGFIRYVIDRRDNWDVDSAKQILSTYEEIRPLENREKSALLALLAFPHKFWKTVASHYRGGKDLESSINTLKQVFAEEQKQERFVNTLQEELG